MDHSTNHTASSDGVNLKVSAQTAKGWRTALFVIFLLGAALRLLRLSWQPLWWDEGYSVYFATEPLARMLWLTAQDIHPPLYYTLLHLWFNLMGSTGPEVARLFSVFVGIVTLPTITWASLTLWPRQRWLALLATLLLAINPIHLYYSQEIRMYGLALLLTLAASTLLWRMQRRLEQGDQPYGLAAAYVIAASLALLTLYYTGLLLLAHQLWTLTANRRHWRRQGWFVTAALLILLIQLPWWLYAFPKLFSYAADKVLADQDTSLPIWLYLWRHWLAFFSGHLIAPQSLLEIVRQLAAALLGIMLIAAAILTKWNPAKWDSEKWNNKKRPLRWLLCLIIIPLLIGFAVNLTYPFFPEGGERLLLQLLPYLLLIVAMLVLNLASTYPQIAVAVFALSIAAAAIGNVIFLTTPRYVADDYRPIIADVIQRSRPNDTILALFPWQVGYWRAYSPRTADGTLLSPQPTAVDQTILRWNETFAARLDSDLGKGTIWFPMPLSFGSTLPAQIEGYLAARARNLENKWYTSATRLTAWVQLDDTVAPHDLNATYPNQLVLASAGASPTTVASANTPLGVDLCWQPPAPRNDLRATLRLLDASGDTWAKRDLTPLANYAALDPANPCREAIAFNVPVGLPPGIYHVAVGVGPEQSDQLFTPNGASSPLVSVEQITVTAPAAAISSHRLPIAHWLPAPASDAGLVLLGYSGPSANTEILAGDEVATTLFLQNNVTHPPTRGLYLSLLNADDAGVAGWQGWPLPSYPTNVWKEGALAQVPISFYLPPDLTESQVRLVAGWVDPATGNKSAPATLTQVQVVRRPTSFVPPAMQFQVMPATEFGTHAKLIGYDVLRDGATLQLELTWQILQTLLPPHRIFVHLLDANGQVIAQSDSEPTTELGRAPTGSWLPGEYLTTQHTLTLPPATQTPFTLHTGLYLPATGARLPATVEGAITGDSATITLPTISLPTAP